MRCYVVLLKQDQQHVLICVHVDMCFVFLHVIFTEQRAHTYNNTSDNKTCIHE